MCDFTATADYTLNFQDLRLKPNLLLKPAETLCYHISIHTAAGRRKHGQGMSLSTCSSRSLRQWTRFRLFRCKSSKACPVSLDLQICTMTWRLENPHSGIYDPCSQLINPGNPDYQGESSNVRQNCDENESSAPQ